MRIHSKLLDWKAVARISLAGWAVSTMLASAGAWLWFQATMTPFKFQLLQKTILAHALVMVRLDGWRSPWLFGHTPTDFLSRLAGVGFDLSPQLDILKTLPLAGLAAVLAGWAIYLTSRRNHG